jgi:hypothetical protein
MDLPRLRQTLQAAAGTDEKTINGILSGNMTQLPALFDPSRSSAEKEESAKTLMLSAVCRLPLDKAIELDLALRRSLGLEESSYPPSSRLDSIPRLLTRGRGVG